MRKNTLFILILLTLSGMAAAAPFTDNGNSTVTDQKTGLVWQQKTAGQRSWESALSYCENLKLGGKSDWRLPDIKELVSIVDLSKPGPAIDSTAFPGTQSSFYWSSTPYVGHTSFAWSVYFYDGSVSSYSEPGSSYVRCVRGGQ